MTLPTKARYVNLKHTTPEDSHFDFMLETGRHLSTWRISVPPDELVTTTAQAEKIFDHKLKFLTYQGPVNKGTGNVIRADKGTYSIKTETPEKLVIKIQADILNGTYILQHKEGSTWQISPA